MDNMDNRDTFGGYGFVVFFILLLWFFSGNMGFGGNRGCGNNLCQDISNCAVEKQQIIDSAKTQYLIETKNAESTAAVLAAQRATNDKIDYYEYMGLRDKLADEQRKNMMLEGRIYADAQYNALNSKLDGIACHQLKAPEFLPYGGYVAPTCGNWGGYNGGCGY